jgi:hemoglobin-like flavoprotein
MHMLGLAVHGLTTPHTLIPAVQELGRRYVVYGVEERHYDVVGNALMLTLEQGLGVEFTSQVRDACFATYELLSGVMKQVADSKAQAA